MSPDNENNKLKILSWKLGKSVRRWKYFPLAKTAKYWVFFTNRDKYATNLPLQTLKFQNRCRRIQNLIILIPPVPLQDYLKKFPPLVCIPQQLVDKILLFFFLYLYLLQSKKLKKKLQVLFYAKFPLFISLKAGHWK